MVKTIKLKRGLDIPLAGVAEHKKVNPSACSKFALMPSSFEGIVPKVVVKEGEVVKVGMPLFVNKNCPDVSFASPVSGVVDSVVRGERRKVLAVLVNADEKQQYVNFGKKDVSAMTSADVVSSLLAAGLFGYINQRPFDVVANPAVTPRAIFVSSLRDMPLAADFEFELEGQEHFFQAGLSALSKIAPTYLGIGSKQKSAKLLGMQDVIKTIFDGPCPAGNVGVQINNIAPINKGEVVWTIEPTSVLFFGRLFCNGVVDLHRTVAVAGSEVKNPAYVDALVGMPVEAILNGGISNGNNRIINGNPLTGKPILDPETAYLGAHTSEISVIPEGDTSDEFLGWIMPRTNLFSVSRSYFSWLSGKKKYKLDSRVKGGERHMIMSGEYDKVMPMDILPEYLIKAIITKDIDKMEQLGIYEVAPEDFALAEFVCSSKMELQRIVREGIDMMINS